MTRDYSNFKNKSNSLEYSNLGNINNKNNDEYYNELNTYKSNHRIKHSNIHISLNKRQTKNKKKENARDGKSNNNQSLYNAICISNGINLNANTNKHKIPKRIEYAHSISLKQSFVTNNINKTENDALDDLYFIDKLEWKNHPLIKINQNVPKLPFNILK